MENTRYMWLNPVTGEFSDSWKKDDFTDSITELVIETSKKEDSVRSGFKLIEYKCLNDDNFEFTKHFKLK